MEKSRVVVIPCSSYDEELVYESMKAGITMLGGIDKFVKPEEKILVKPNFLSPAEEDKSIVTHPSIIKGMLRLLNENGYTNVKYGDSPGHGTCHAAAGKIGLNESNTYGAVLADMSEEVTVDFPEGKTCKEFHYCKEVVEADAIIGLCKMKTHMLERVTGAVKNMYGLVCGFRKAAGHVKFPNDGIFARAVADIHRSTPQRLHVMDGIIAMEGNGPASGVPTPMNVLLFSADPVALDTVFCHLIYLDPKFVPTNVQGADMGIGQMDDDKIEIIIGSVDGNLSVVEKAELQEKLGNEKFDVARAVPKKTVLERFSVLSKRFGRRPAIDASKCIKCGICVNHCPVPEKAVNFKNGKSAPPVYDYNKCIRCYCCQEMCPQKAIYVKGKY